MRKRPLFSALLIGVAMLASSCSKEEWYFGKGEPAPLRTISIVEARREAVALELELYELLETEFGIGNWEAPPPTGNSQVGHSLLMECESEGLSEAWFLAHSNSTPKKNNWDQIITKVGEFLAPKGFGSARRIDRPDSSRAVQYVNPTTGARVYIGFKLATLVIVDTGCVKARLFQDWPKGAEGVPAHLRTSGRGTKRGQEIWPEQTPTTTPEESTAPPTE